MADVTLETEAKFINGISGPAKEAQADYRAMAKTIQESSEQSAMAVKEAENSIVHLGEAHSNLGHHIEQEIVTHREFKRAMMEGMLATQIASEAMEHGFVGAHGAVEAITLAFVGLTAGPIVGGLMIVAATVAAIAKHIEEVSKNAKDVSWFGDPDRVEAMSSALHNYDTALTEINKKRDEDIKKMAEASHESVKDAEYNQLALEGLSGGLSGYTEQVKNSEKETKELTSAEKEIADEFGTTVEALEKAHGGHAQLMADIQKLLGLNDDLIKSQRLVNDLEAQKQVLQAKGELEVTKAGSDPVAKVRAENDAKMAAMVADQEIRVQKKAMFEDQINILEQEKALEGDENKKKEIEKQLRMVEDRLDREKDEVKSGKEAIRILTENADLKLAQAEEQQNADAEARFMESMNRRREKAAKEYAAYLKQIQDSQNVLEEAQAGKDPLKLDDVKFKKELQALGDNEKAKDNIVKAHTLYREQLIEEEHKKEMDAMLSSEQNFVSALSNLVTEMGGKSREMAAVEKALAITDIGIKTAQAYMGAVAAFPVTMGEPQASLILATGALEEAAVAAKGFSMGTLNAPGGMAWVGERGPELMEVPAGSRIYSNSESQGMMGGINHNGDVVIQVSVPAGANPEVGRQVAQRAREEWLSFLRDVKRANKEIQYRNVPDL